MSSGKYRVSVNGFRVMSETWDDVLQLDGKRDEVYISSQVMVVDKTGRQLFSNQPTSPVMGDTWGHNGRIQAGSGGDRGGLRTGDSFPDETPWRPAVFPNDERDWPPTVIWEGELVSGENVALITPSIWEWDPGGDFFSGWLSWGADQLTSIGPKVKELIGGTGAVVVDAVSLGLGVAVSMFEVGGPMGSSGSRPIGMQRDAANPKTYTFNPQVLTLNYEAAELIANSEPSGRGKGVLTLRFVEDRYFRGEYLLYVQVERTGGPPPGPDASWESLGGQLTSGPAAASWAENRLDVFSRSIDSSLAHKWYENGWSEWESLGGVLESDPAAVSWGAGRIDVVVRGTDSALWHKWYENAWSEWESLGGILTAGPSICSWGPGRLDIFTRGTDKSLWHKAYENGWTEWESLGGLLESDPASVSWSAGRIDVFSRGADSTLQHIWFENEWSSWESLGGHLTSGPAVASWGPGRLDVFSKDPANSLSHIWFEGNWSPWETLGAESVTSDPDAVSWASGRLDVFARGSDNALVHKWFDGSWGP